MIRPRRLGALAEKFGLMPHRSQVLLLSAWANATGSGAAEAARLIDAEIDKATAVGTFPRYYLGLAGEVLLAAGRPADGLAQLDRAIGTIDEPASAFICQNSIACGANVCWRSAAGTRPRRGRRS
jgi:hypothetical protein